MVVALHELAPRMLADYDARTQGQCTVEALDLTTAQAYALQAEIARLRVQRGEKVIGYKVGCTSRAIQMQLGVKEPIFGRLFDTECHPSGAHLSSARYANLAVEAEMGVRLSQDLSDAPLSAEACRDAIAELFPVIELHHYVLPPAWSPGQWLIASNGIHAGFVLPDREPRPAGSVHCDYSLQIHINEVVVGTAEDAASLVHPIESVRWLAGRLATFRLRLFQGQLILTGSPLPLYPVAPGSRIVVEAPPLGVSCLTIDD
jgi:2-keto-4-pentenoate hydratase